MTKTNQITLYIARDEDGQLMMFRNKPTRGKMGRFGKWSVSNEQTHYGTAPAFLAPALRWNDEPIEVKFEKLNQHETA